MKRNNSLILKLFNFYIAVAALLLTACSDFLEEHVPQGTLSEEQVKSTENAEAMVVSAYAIFTTAEDINSSINWKSNKVC